MDFKQNLDSVYKRICPVLVNVIIITIFALVGCAQNTSYNIMIRNSGVSEFSHAEVVFGLKRISVGWVMPGYYAMHIDQNMPFPEKATVRWQRENSTVIEKEIFVKKLLPKRSYNETYTLIFVIDENENVELKVVLCTKDLPCPEKYKK